MSHLLKIADDLRSQATIAAIDSMPLAEATPERLYGDAGTKISGINRGTAYTQRLAETVELIANVYQGKASRYRLEEVMTSSDFPLMFGDILDRVLLAAYNETPAVWSAIARRRVVSNFRNVRTFDLTGIASYLPAVNELAGYEARAMDEVRTTWQLTKYGARVPLSWELMLLDDLGMINEIPTLLGRGARRTEERFITTLYVASTGPHASVYTSGNANIVTGNPALSITGLQTAMTVLGNMLDSGGDPISVEAITLVVPPALEVTARNIVNATQIIVGADSAAQRILSQNWMSGMRIAVNPYLNLINTTNGDTAWYLFASPKSGRPAIEMGFLRGHESPEIFMKSPNAVRVGGGTAGPEDFDTDAIDYKIRHVLGGAVVDAKMTVASEGDGT